MGLKFLLLSFSLFPAKVNSSVPELGFKFDGISVRMLLTSNLEARNKITEKCTLKSIGYMILISSKPYTMPEQLGVFTGSRDF